MPTISAALKLAVEHHQNGQFEQAEYIYRQILRAAPQQPDALHLLGLLIYQSGQQPELAVQYISQAVAVKPEVAQFHNSLGSALCAAGRPEEAVERFRRAIELEADLAEAHSNLGSVLVDQGRWEQALISLKCALQINPQLADAHLNMGHALLRGGQLQPALHSFDRAAELQPHSANALFCLGNAQQTANQLGRAAASYRRALQCDPQHTAAHINLGNTLRLQGQLDQAIACYQQALKLQPDSADVLNNLGDALEGQGRVDEAVHSYQRALELNPEFVDAHSNLLLAEQYRPGVSLARLAARHAEWNQRHAAALAPAEEAWPNTRLLQRPLRLGFVSADFGRHPVAHFSLRYLESLDPSEFTAHLYSNRSTQDGFTARFQNAASVWREVWNTSDSDLGDLIRADQIDILFDLAGHTRGNRLLVFARRAAPIQISWIGYAGTTGMTAMDYLLADRFHVPAEHDPYYAEHVIRLPAAHVCFDPPNDAPAVASLPGLTRGHITFGSFNNPAKITPQVVEVWAEILRRLPDAKLLLKYQGLDQTTTRNRYRHLFAQHAIDAERIEFQGKSPHAEMLAAYQRVDIGLDPFPFCGGMTTCLALWMGVPVVTLPGETFAGRQSLSFLSHMGLTTTVAADRAEYIERAVGLAQELSALAQLRTELRGRLAKSPLCDAPRFTDQLNSTLRQLWKSWCRC